MEPDPIACANAGPDETCPSALQDLLSPIAAWGVPLLMLALTWWLVGRFYGQVRAKRAGPAALTIVGGYLGLLAVMYASVMILSATATSWGRFMMSFSLTWGSIVFVYTPAWLIAWLFAATKRDAAASSGS